MSGPWDDKTPNTQYRMLWGGEWRPVLNMYDASGTPTTLPGHATGVVLYAPSGDRGPFVATSCGPADVLTNPDHVTTEWEMVH